MTDRGHPQKQSVDPLNQGSKTTSMLSNKIPLSIKEKIHAKATSICLSDLKRKVG